MDNICYPQNNVRRLKMYGNVIVQQRNVIYVVNSNIKTQYNDR